MGIIPPYMPSALWYAQWLAALADGKSPENAVPAANLSSGDLREFARGVIVGHSSGEIVLTVPLKGGAKILRHPLGSVIAEISGHGDWRRIHLGALEACYGKTPFFIHLFPMLKEVIEHDFFYLRDFNAAIHSVLSSFILQDINPGDIYEIFSEDIDHILKRRKEVARFINPHLSLVDSLMRFGPETLLGIMKLEK